MDAIVSVFNSNPYHATAVLIMVVAIALWVYGHPSRQ
jgi:hypothetical protein